MVADTSCDTASFTASHVNMVMVETHNDGNGTVGNSAEVGDVSFAGNFSLTPDEVCSLCFDE